MNLTTDDLGRWADALLHLPDSNKSCLDWVLGPMHRFFPFERLYMAHGMLVAGEITITHWQSHGYETAYLEQLERSFELEKRGALAWWVANRKPFVIDPACPLPFVSAFELDEIKTFGLRNVAAHGVLNLRASAGTYFSFAGLSEPLSGWHLDALRVLTPVLNDLYLTEITSTETRSPVFDQLSARQRAIIRAVVAGQDHKTMARQLGIAPQTVKNQLSQLYQQLNITTRAQLIGLLK